MMYDDVVNSTSNPYPGKLFNRPHGEDVYAGLKIDYKVGAFLSYKKVITQQDMSRVGLLSDYE